MPMTDKQIDGFGATLRQFLQSKFQGRVVTPELQKEISQTIGAVVTIADELVEQPDDHPPG